MFDAIDYKILSYLYKNGRMPCSELASKLDLSSPSTADRIRRLEEKGAITGFSTNICFSLIGLPLLSFVMTNLSHPKFRKKFLELVDTFDEIQECHHITGDDDYLLKIRCVDTEHLDHLLSDRIKRIPGVAKTKTTIVLSTAKESSHTLSFRGKNHDS